MLKERAEIIKTEMLSEGVFGMHIKTRAAQSALPGQFVMLFPADSSHLLGRPISICDLNRDAGILRLVWRKAGYGTGEFSRLEKGGTIEVLGPLGNGFDIDALKPGAVAAVLGGGIGAPPLLGLVKALSQRGIGCEVFLGYRGVSQGLFLADEFKDCGNVHIATDDGSEGFHGTVTEALRESRIKADIIFSCGPMPMLRSVKSLAEETGTEAYISLEERMACGVGACLGCVVKLKHKDGHSNVNNARICTEGPVFAAKDVNI